MLKLKVGSRIGLVTGTFDLLHHGHMAYLEKAKGVCDCLVIGVVGDASLKQKGGTSVLTAVERASGLSMLESVDFVFIHDDSTDSANVSELSPSVYVCSSDELIEDVRIRHMIPNECEIIMLDYFERTHRYVSLIQNLKPRKKAFK